MTSYAEMKRRMRTRGSKEVVQRRTCNSPVTFAALQNKSVIAMLSDTRRIRRNDKQTFLSFSWRHNPSHNYIISTAEDQIKNCVMSRKLPGFRTTEFQLICETIVYMCAFMCVYLPTFITVSVLFSMTYLLPSPWTMGWLEFDELRYQAVTFASGTVEHFNTALSPAFVTFASIGVTEAENNEQENHVICEHRVDRQIQRGKMSAVGKTTIVCDGDESCLNENNDVWN